MVLSGKSTRIFAQAFSEHDSPGFDVQEGETRIRLYGGANQACSPEEGCGWAV